MPHYRKERQAPVLFHQQEMIYQVMLHIINQDIPQKVINNPAPEWQPYSNKVTENGNIINDIHPDKQGNKIKVPRRPILVNIEQLKQEIPF